MTYHPEKNISFLEFSEFTKSISLLAAEIALKNFDSNLNFSEKSDGTIVTEADIEIEKLLRAKIIEKYPTHSIEGEEQPPLSGKSSYKWILDPLDGTFNFVRGIPFYGILIGLMKGDDIIYGSYRLPSYKNVFCSGDGKTLKIIGFSRVSAPRQPHVSALLLTTDEKRIESSIYEKPWKQLKKQGFEVRSWGDCFGYHLLLSGKAEIMMDIDLKECDIIPLIPILRAAGLEIIQLSENYCDLVVCTPYFSKIVKQILTSKK